MTDWVPPCWKLRDLFFSEDDENAVFTAKQVCNSCSAQVSCLELALQQELDHGIWGGTTPDERFEIRKRRLRDRRRRVRLENSKKMKDSEDGLEAQP